MINYRVLSVPMLAGVILFASCNSSQLASSGADNLYFMASDEKLATEYAVQNNNPEQFETLAEINSDFPSEESFSSRNVNPDYIARYQSETPSAEEDIVYFDEGQNPELEGEGSANIDAYNNYYSAPAGGNSGFNPTFNMNIGFMGGFSPWGYGYNPWMWGSGWGFNPGLSIGIGFGFGSPFWGPNFGLGWGMPIYPGWGWGYPGYGWGAPGFGWGPGWGYRPPIYILPGGEYGDRRIVRGPRPTRGSTLAGTNAGLSSAALPNTARAQARRGVTNNKTSNNRGIVNSSSARTAARDFSSSQNDYYNSSRSRLQSRGTRNVGSAASSRSSAVRSRSSVPTRSSIAPNSAYSRSSTRSAYSRNGYTNRNSSPSYNRMGSRSSYGTSRSSNFNTRSNSTLRNYSTPSRSSRSNYTPNRSSGGRSSVGSMSRGSSGGSRVSSGGSRGGSSGGSRGGGGRGN